MSDLFGLRADLMKGDIFWVLPLLPSFCFFLYSFLLQVPLLPPCYGSYSWSFSFFLILLFYFIFCYRLIDSLVRNPLLMPDLFGLLTDLIKGDLFFFVLPLLPSFILVFFPLLFLATGSTPVTGSVCRISKFCFPSFFLPCAGLAPS
jgi:hypothetical protein